MSLNGGQYTVRPGTTANTFVLGGNGFSSLTQYALATAYGAFTITNVDRSNPVQQVVTFDVPADVIVQLLRERPKVAGLAVPGMPLGSPGMESPGRTPERYDVLAFDAAGSTRVYARR